MSEQQSDNRSFLANPAVLWGGVAVVVLLILGVGGYFLWPIVFGGGKTAMLCEKTMQRTLDYGVVPFNAKLSSKSAEETKTDNRYVCNAAAGTVTYKITVDMTCDDLKDTKCFRLFNVTQSDGTALFQRQE